MTKLSNYLAHLSNARVHLSSIESSATAQQALKANLLLFESTCLGATGLLCSPAFDFLYADESLEVASSLLSTGSDGAPLLQPLMYESRSFEEIADRMLTDGTIIMLSRDELIRRAKMLDSLQPCPKIVGPGNYLYWEKLRRTYGLVTELSAQYDDETVRAADALSRWLDALSPDEVKDFRQSSVWRRVDGLDVNKRLNRQLKLASDNAYQATMAQCGDACLSLALSRSELPLDFVGRVRPLSRIFGTAESASIEHITAQVPFFAVESYDFADIARLARTAPYRRLQAAISDYCLGKKLDASIWTKALEDCTEPMRELASVRGPRARHEKIAVWQRGLKSAKRSRLITTVAVAGELVSLALYSGPFSWLITASNLMLIAAEMMNNARLGTVKSANFIQAGSAYAAILTAIETRSSQARSRRSGLR